MSRSKQRGHKAEGKQRVRGKAQGQVFTLDNFTFLSYVFLPWLAPYGSNTTERCTT